MVDCLICGDDHPSMAPHRPGAIQKLRAEVESERTARREAEEELDIARGESAEWQHQAEWERDRHQGAESDRAQLIAAVEDWWAWAQRNGTGSGDEEFYDRVRSVSQGDSE